MYIGHIYVREKISGIMFLLLAVLPVGQCAFTATQFDPDPTMRHFIQFNAKKVSATLGIR